MKCDCCPLCPSDDVCPESEGRYGIEYKDGTYGCKHPRNWIDKKDIEISEYYENIGIDMDIEMSLTESELNHAIELCKHMIGLDRRKPYHRHGKVFYKGYRNYFSAPICGNKILDKLPHYIIEREITAKRVCYALTLDGLKWLSRQLKIIIKIDEL